MILGTLKRFIELNIAVTSNWSDARIKNIAIEEKFDSRATGTQACLTLGPPGFAFVFRGTEPGEWIDILTDLKATKSETPYVEDDSDPVKVHSGFLESYLSVRDNMLTIGKQVLDQGDVSVTGHSLGGALAQLFALDLEWHRDNVWDNRSDYAVKVVTFGSPRVGNSYWATKYNQRVPETSHVINAHDPVPFIPKFGYRRSGVPIFVGKKKLLGLIRPSRINDHMLDAYMEAIC